MKAFPLRATALVSALCASSLATAAVTIGNNVWIGAKATITKGVTIGDNAVIGAGAVVTHDIPADCLAVGVPARVVRRAVTPG